MTPDTAARPAEAGGHSILDASEMDILAGLWEHAHFPRLPPDAPNELSQLLEDIENPKRVYAIHKAARRHRFQILLQKFIVQLREGCGVSDCQTPTCFTCRKRLAGRTPIRRYNLTSARTLATHLASQDNPESALCPNLRTPRGPPAAAGLLKIQPVSSKQRARDDVSNDPTKPTEVGAQSGGLNGKARVSNALGTERTSGEHTRQCDLTITEEATSKDHRSYASNIFNTVAFKMLEWLTPTAIDDLVSRVRSLRDEPNAAGQNPAGPVPKSPASADPRLPSSAINGTTLGHLPANGQQHTGSRCGASQDGKGEKDILPQREPGTSRSAPSRRNSNAKVRKSSGPKPQRKLSVDAFSVDSLADDAYSGMVRSPRGTGAGAVLPDKGPRPLKTAGSAIPRPISQLSSAGYFDDVSLERMPLPKPLEIRAKTGRAPIDGRGGVESNGSTERTASSGLPSDRSFSEGSARSADVESESEDDCLLPQSLSRLTPDVVDFLCDVIQEDGTAESHLLEPPAITKFHQRTTGHKPELKRKGNTSSQLDLKKEWKLFIEQTFFFVLSDPQRVIRSFTKKGHLYDSLTLWYCMLRMTRVAPSLVFHSLWTAAAGLFAPPKSLHILRSPKTKLFPSTQASLSNVEAGRLLSVCFHALVAAAPLVNDKSKRYEITRIRSHGMVLDNSGAVAQQPAELCLQYEDALSDPSALRLARRLFSAIVTRRCFDELRESNIVGEDEANEPDVLAPLLSQLDYLNENGVYLLPFSMADRASHETRIQSLLLDWARVVMFNEWDGTPWVPGDGTFGGALAVTEAMYKTRKDLLINDSQFRSDYFAERLDTMEMPYAWLSYTSTRQRVHLLDYPFIFSPNWLVSFFRSINVSRMNHSYEESVSLQDKIKASMRIPLPSAFEGVLLDNHRAAMAKYLILNIDRNSVMKDTFDQLWRREERELLRPLKVLLGASGGEEGFDSGGVQQEFFRLVISEALNPAYGAFTVDDRTRMAWFVPGSTVEEWQYEMIGLLFSLAVYNGLTLPVTFPNALYRKLLGEPVTELHHIEDGWPELASGLNKLAEWNEEKDGGSVEDVFCLTYEFSAESLGKPVTRIMNPSHTNNSDGGAQNESWPQFGEQKTPTEGSSTPVALQDAQLDSPPNVTGANRDEYVHDYVRYLTDVSVRPQYEAFARGFRRCLHPKSLKLLSPDLLQSVVEGVQDIDISELKRHARYMGWDATHRTVRDFWAVVRKYDDNMKRKLLAFVTASDRVPVGGVQNLLFQIQRNGEEMEPPGRLPTSYTCYGTLLLPEYRDRDMLRERLAMALENAQGFGFA